MLKIYLLAAVALLAGALGMNAQVVTTEPSPLQEDSQNVVIYFHADQGNMGLKDQPASTALYAHTGVSTIDGNGKVSDWQYVPAAWNTNLPKCKARICVGKSLETQYRRYPHVLWCSR